MTLTRVSNRDGFTGPMGSGTAGEPVQSTIACIGTPASHTQALIPPSHFSAQPHSVHVGLVPTGYAHFGHRPRLIRERRRSANGAANSSHSKPA